MTLYRVLLPHPIERRLLMMNVHGESRLPEWEDNTPFEWQDTDHVNRAVAARFGMETTVLRCLWSRADPRDGRLTRVYELDNHSAPHDVPASTWISRAELGLLRITEPESRELVNEWFGRQSGELHVRGQPWTRRGWFVEALSWTVARLRDAGATIHGTPAHIRAWERSFVMRADSDAGRFFFRAVPPVFRHEPALLRWLDQRYPFNFADIVAVDVDRGWILQREVGRGAMPLSEEREEEVWYRTFRTLADIQRACVPHVRDLLALGCPDRRLRVLAARIPRLCADAGAMLLGEDCGLTRTEIERVAALVPTFLGLCDELAACGVPETLEYGNLRAANVLCTLGESVFLDWSDSSISHPFFSVPLLMHEAVGLLPGTSVESRLRLRDSFLGPWAEHAPTEKLLRAFDIAWLLAPIHLAAIVHAEVIPAAGHRWEIECMVPEFLRVALTSLDEHAHTAQP